MLNPILFVFMVFFRKEIYKIQFQKENPVSLPTVKMLLHTRLIPRAPIEKTKSDGMASKVYIKMELF